MGNDFLFLWSPVVSMAKCQDEDFSDLHDIKAISCVVNQF